MRSRAVAGLRSLSRPDTPAPALARLDPPLRLAPGVRVRVFDDEAVAFNPCTWETHVLNAAATLALQQLRRGPCRRADIESLLSRALGDGERARAAEHAGRLVDELAALKLIAREPEPAHARR